MDDFRETYKQMDDDQLLGVYREKEGLETEAQMALQAEMALRHIGPDEVEAFRKHLERTEKKDKRRQRRRIGNAAEIFLFPRVPGRIRTRLIILLVVLLICLALEIFRKYF
jgi:hypothetical protein